MSHEIVSAVGRVVATVRDTLPQKTLVELTRMVHGEPYDKSVITEGASIESKDPCVLCGNGSHFALDRAYPTNVRYSLFFCYWCWSGMIGAVEKTESVKLAREVHGSFFPPAPTTPVNAVVKPSSDLRGTEDELSSRQ